jgi:hypothetical protein
MSVTACKHTPAAEALRSFPEADDAALEAPVILTRNGRPRTAPLSVEALQRLLANARSVFLAKDMPAEFIDQIEAIGRGDFAAAGVTEGDDRRAG